MRPYSFRLTASAVEPFNIKAQGNYVRYRKVLTGIFAPEILIETDQGDLIPLLPGEYAYLGKLCEEFKVFNVAGSTTMTGVLMIAGGTDGVHTGSDRISGEVSVTDGGRSKTLGNAAFIGLNGNGASGASNFNNFQIINPTGSGINTILSSIKVKSSTAHTVGMGRYDTNLGNLSYGVSKLIGGAHSLTEMRQTAGVTQFADGGGTVDSFTVPANTSTVFTFPEPLVLEPGKGLNFWDATLNVDLTIAYYFTEEGR